MDREQVESTSVKSRGYDPETQTVEVEFNSGAVYQYEDVPQDTYDEWLAADSAGRWFAANLRHHQPQKKVE